MTLHRTDLAPCLKQHVKRALPVFLALSVVLVWLSGDLTVAGQPRGQAFSVPEGVVQNGRFVEIRTGVVEPAIASSRGQSSGVLPALDLRISRPPAHPTFLGQPSGHSV